MSKQGPPAPGLILNPPQNVAKNASVTSQMMQIASKQGVASTKQLVNAPIQQTSYTTTQPLAFPTPQSLPYLTTQPLPYPSISPLQYLAVQQPGFQPFNAFPPAQPAYAPSPPYQYQAPPSPIQQQPALAMVMGPVDLQDYLRNATTFHVEQHIELLELITGFETENRYTVKDQMGNIIFYVRERGLGVVCDVAAINSELFIYMLGMYKVWIL